MQHPVERSVDVQTAEALPSTVPLGLSVTTAVLLVLVTFGTALVLLVVGPEPRLGTRWAWFWMTGGGWAFLAQLLLAPLLMRALTGS